MSALRLLPVPALLAALALALAPARSAPPAAQPVASARAFAVKVAVPGREDVATQTLSAPPEASSTLDSYTTRGVATGLIIVGASVQPGSTALANASADVSGLLLFDGEITADGVSAQAGASAGPDGADGDVSASAVANLVVLGRTVEPKPNLRVPLADWGYLVVLSESSDRGVQAGARSYDGTTVGLDVHLTAEHGGLPAGTEILVGDAEASATAAPPPSVPEPKAPSTPRPGPSALPHGLTGPGLTAPGPSAHPKKAEKAKKKPKKPKKKKPGPLKATPKLGAGAYVFPVFGATSWGDTYGAPRSDIPTGWHHGDDIFGRLGQPVVAVTSGTVFAVGWNKVGGNRLWLRDRHGNQFYYAHLAAFSMKAADGAHVRAGQVLGFMGNTGDAVTTPYHLHFEIHPVSLLYRKYNGAVDPTTYLDRWRVLREISLPSASAWVPRVRHGGVTAPAPGAVLFGVTDVSQAAALTPASLRRALARPPQP